MFKIVKVGNKHLLRFVGTYLNNGNKLEKNFNKYFNNFHCYLMGVINAYLIV